LNDIDDGIYTIVKGNIIGDKEFADVVAGTGKYDIVVANILADVIIPLSGVVRRFMKDDGVFISSGIINTKEDEVRKALVDNGFEIVDVKHMGEWVSFVAK
jgi:ribosomal protein L11 methyltransferase